MTIDNEAKILKYIVLTRMKGLGPVTQNSLLSSCGDIQRCFEASSDDLISLSKIKQIGRSRIESFIVQRNDKNLWIQAEKILSSLEASGIKMIVYDDMEFPYRFKNLKDMPIVLYLKGMLVINGFRNSIGIIGARRCTIEGKQTAIDISAKAAETNTAVISGMAKGIDSYAHTAAIKSHGYTIAVLGNGADICYPKEHERLFEEITEHGCVLSEYPPGTPPRAYHFPRRNRLIAALSDKLYVIDAGRNSGTQSTIEYSMEYDREVIMYGESILKPNKMNDFPFLKKI